MIENNQTEAQREKKNETAGKMIETCRAYVIGVLGKEERERIGQRKNKTKEYLKT